MTEEYKKRPGPQKYFYKGKPVSLKNLAEMAGCSEATMSRRLNKKNLTPEQAVDDPFGTGVNKKKETKQQRIITYNGITDTISGWSKRLGIRWQKLYARLYTEPTWSYDEALGGAPRQRPNSPKMTVITPDGPVTKTRVDWSKERNIKIQTIAKRLARGWTDSQALEFEDPPPTSLLSTGKYVRSPEQNEARRRRWAERRKRQQKED